MFRVGGSCNFPILCAHFLLTCAWHSWSLNSEGSIACHTYCETGRRLRGPVTFTTIAERLAVELSLSVFTTLLWRGWESNTQPSACRSSPLRHRRSSIKVSLLYLCTKKHRSLLLIFLQKFD